MATTKPRITITLTKRQHDVMKSISDLSGQPMSKMVSELVEVSLPTLERMAATFQAVQRARDEERAKMLAAMDEAQRVVEPIVMEAVGQFDMFLGKMEAAATGREAGGDTAATGARSATGAAGAAQAGEGESPRPVITGATEVQRRSDRGRGEAQGAVQKPKRRKASRDEQAGIDWWNGLNERQRATWCRNAGTAVPAEAWAYYKATSKTWKATGAK